MDDTVTKAKHPCQKPPRNRNLRRNQKKNQNQNQNPSNAKAPVGLGIIV